MKNKSQKQTTIQKESLQILTTLNDVQGLEKANKLLELEQIQKEDLKELTKEEQETLFQEINKRLNTAQSEEFDKLVHKISPIISEDSKKKLWDATSSKIIKAASDLINERGCVPSATEIANKVKLSRQTVSKHLKGLRNHPDFVERLEQLKLLTSNLLAKLYTFGMRGNMKAASLYLQAMGVIETHNTHHHVKHQNNYVQINGTILNDEVLNNLTPEQLSAIEAIINTPKE